MIRRVLTSENFVLVVAAMSLGLLTGLLLGGWGGIFG